jgi:hypothetical protein
MPRRKTSGNDNFLREQMNKPTRPTEFKAVAESGLKCPTCGSSDLRVRFDAGGNTPVGCRRCGDYIGRLAELREKARQSS